MKEKIIAKRYAEAFLRYAKASIGKERPVSDLKNLKIILRSNLDFEEFLYNPEITYSEKCEVIDKVLQGVIAEETRNFLKLLIEKERIEFIIEICDYVRINYSHGEAVDAVLKTSYPLDTEFIQAIKGMLEEKLQGKLNLFLDLDPSLLGGVQVRIGNYIIDGSVRRRLDELKEKLMAVQAI